MKTITNIITLSLLACAHMSTKAPNIEIKAHYKDLDKARAICQRLNATHVGMDHQIDTYFVTPKGRFKLRESNVTNAMLIPYMRPDQQEAKKSDYSVIYLKEEQVALTKDLFTRILGIDVVVDKERDFYLLNNVKIHLDTVKGLGSFFEFEAVYKDDTAENRAIETTKVEELIKTFEIKQEDLIQGSYRELMKNKITAE